MISQSRWDWVIEEVASSLEYFGYGNELTDDEFKLVISTLKNNTPFQVVPDHLVGNNIANDNVVLETKNFSVIDNGEMNV